MKVRRQIVGVVRQLPGFLRARRRRQGKEAATDGRGPKVAAGIDHLPVGSPRGIGAQDFVDVGAQDAPFSLDVLRPDLIDDVHARLAIAAAVGAKGQGLAVGRPARQGIFDVLADLVELAAIGLHHDQVHLLGPLAVAHEPVPVGAE